MVSARGSVVKGSGNARLPGFPSLRLTSVGFGGRPVRATAHHHSERHEQPAARKVGTFAAMCGAVRRGWRILVRATSSPPLGVNRRGVRSCRMLIIVSLSYGLPRRASLWRLRVARCRSGGRGVMAILDRQGLRDLLATGRQPWLARRRSNRFLRLLGRERRGGRRLHRNSSLCVDCGGAGAWLRILRIVLCVR